MKKRIIQISITIMLIISTALSLFGCNESVDYLKDDLSRYITLSENDYKNYTLKLDFDEVDSSDVERKIMKLLYSNRSTTPEYNGGNVKNLPISIGDKVYIYYRCYTVDENGVEKDLENASNLLGEMNTLDIGSCTFIKGFEEGLIGKNPIDYEPFELISSGNVKHGDVIYLSYSVMLPDGTMYSRKSERIDLGAKYIDSIYGKGFSKFFQGAAVGVKIPSSTTFEMEDGTAVYYDMTVNYKTTCEKNPITIDAYFPMDYSEVSLRSTNVKFDVYVRYINVYNVPEYNEDFIKNTLKVTDEELAEYEGTTTVEKHRAYLLAELRAENMKKRQTLKEDAMWNYYNSKVKVKKLPSSEVENVYNDYYYETVAAFQTYGAFSYESLDAFARAYYMLDSESDWLAYIKERAKAVVTEKIIFYYIIRRENLLPSDAEFESLYNKAVEEYFEYYSEELYKEELEKIKDEAEKAKRLAEIKAEMLDYYGEDYFKEMVYYDYSLEKLTDFATIE